MRLCREKSIRNWERKSITVILALGLALTTGCASTKPVTVKTPLQELQAPEWVRKGSGSFGDERGRIFYGVSSASHIENPSLLRAAAENRARNEVAKVFQYYTTSLTKDYMASTSADGTSGKAEEQRVEQVIKTVTKMTLSGVEIIDHWQNPATGEMFALARLDLAAFKDNVEKAGELDAKTREYIQQNAERLHERLEKAKEDQERRQ